MNTHSCRLALTLPDPASHSIPSETLAQVLALDHIAALMVPDGAAGFTGGDDSQLRAAQERGIACLAHCPASRSMPAGYDGIMFDRQAGVNDLKNARTELGDDVMIGALCDGSRDDAMVKGDAGIDVLGFSHDGAPEKLGPLCEIINWWSELFVVPSLVTGNIGISAAGAIIKSGADFIAPVEPVWLAPTGPAPALKSYQDLLAGKGWA